MKTKPFVASTLLALAVGLLVLGTGEARAQAGPTGTSNQIYSGGARWPAVAYDSTNHVYLVVFGSGGAIKGRFVSEGGSAVGDTFTINTGDYAQTPRVAYGAGAGGFLVTWQGWDGVQTHGWAVTSRKVVYPGGAVGAASVLSDPNTLGEFGPAVEYSTGAGRFLVAWVANWDLSARLVDGNGAAVGGRMSITATAADSDRDPAVGYFPDSNRFVVVWSAYNEAGHYSTARAQFIDASSGAGVGSPAQLGQSGTIYVPEVTYNPSSGRMFVVWMQGYSGGFRPFGMHIDGNGAPSGSPTLLSSTVGTYDANSIGYNVRTDSYFLVTQPPGTVLKQDWGFEISSAGAPLATASAVTSIPEVSGFTGAFHPRLAPSTQEGRWLIGTVGSFTSVWTQLIAGNAIQPPPDGGGGGGTYSLSISPAPVGGSVSGGGLLCGSAGSTCLVTSPSATTLTISAIPDTDYTFAGWSGSCTGTNPTVNVSVDGVKTCSAIFTWAGSGPPPGCLAAPTPSFSAPGPIGSSVKHFDGAVRWPAVAYDACNQVYLTVWGSGGTIRGQFVKDDGTAAGGVFSISSGNFSQTPRAAYSPDTGRFLVTWHSTEQTSPSPRAVVRAAVVAYPGGTAVPGTILSGDTYSSQWEIGAPVAYATGARQFLVAWARFGEVHARLVDNSGNAVGTEIPLSSGAADYERDPAVGYFTDVDRFVVAWSAYNEAGAYSQGRAQLLSASTGAAVGSPVAFAQSGYVYVPEVALNSDTGKLLLAWIQGTTSGWRPYGRLLNSDGTFPSASGSILSSTVGAYDANSVAYNRLSKSFFLVTHGSTLQDWGFEISGVGAAAGTAASLTNIPEGTGYTGAFNPRLAASTMQPRWLLGTAGSFNTLWTQLVGGTEPGSGTPVYQLTISPAPSGGTVSGGGVSCGTGGTTCQVTFGASTTVNLTATPDSGYVFTTWGGACSGTSATTSVLVDAARTCSATFTSTGGGTTYQLSISPTPANGTVSGGGLNCGTAGSACQVTVPASTVVTLSAAPDAGYSFTSWGGSCAGTSPTTTVTVDAAKSCSATFTAGLPSGPPFSMTISPKPAGGTITAAGLNCGTSGNLCSVTMPASMPFGMQAVPDAGYKFGAWSGNCQGTSANLTIQLSGPRTCSATFTPVGTVYQLNISPTPTGGTVTGGGLGCGTAGGTCQVTYANIASITVTATPDAGYVFSGWGGACAGTSASTTVNVDGVKTCTAAFSVAPTYQLTVAPVPTGGTVSGGGITCGTGGSSCQASYGSATQVSLTASPDSGYAFGGWGGSCSGTGTSTTVSVDGAKTCTATFTLGPVNGPPYTLTISPKPSGGTVAGAGINCGTGGSACSVTMPAPMTIGIQATADSGYTFAGWTGNCSGTAAAINVQLNGPRTCSAVFSPVGTTYRLTISPVPTGGTVDGGGIGCGVGGSTCQVTYPSMTMVTLAATPASGYTFTGWGGACTGTSTSTSVQVDGTKTCTATFAAIQTYQLTIAPVPTGGTVTGGGLTCGTGGSTCQTTYVSPTQVTLTAAPATGYTFAGWGGACGGTAASTTVQVDAVKTCSATFTAGPVNGPPYTLTITPPTGGRIQGAGLNCGDGSTLCSVTMPAPMTIGITATASTGYSFTGWTGDCSGTASSVWVQLNGPRTCGATFTPTSAPTYRLAISPAPTGGTVTGNGLNCGVGGSTCEVTFGSATTATLTAAPASGYTFANWGGSCSGTSTTTTVLVDNIRTCSATFTSTSGPPSGPPYTLTITLPTGGKVTGAGLNCGAGGTLCSVTMPAPMTIGIQATPSAGYTFAGWSGDCAGTTTGIWVALGGPRTCSALFTPTGSGSRP